MSFPALYHAHHLLYQEDLDFWLELASRYPGPLLEAGCGTGRVILPLARTGIPLIGLDIDFGMLQLLRDSLPEDLSQKVWLLQADFTHFHLDAAFRLVLLTCNTYTTLTQAQRVETLKAVKKHLHPDGKFAVSLPNPELLRTLPRRSPAQLEEIFPHPYDGEPVQVSSEWKKDPSTLKLLWHYDHLLPNGEVERVSVQTVQHQTSYAELNQEFQSAGFQIEKTWGDFQKSDYSDDSPHLIILASSMEIE